MEYAIQCFLDGKLTIDEYALVLKEVLRISAYETTPIINQMLTALKQQLDAGKRLNLSRAVELLSELVSLKENKPLLEKLLRQINSSGEKLNITDYLIFFLTLTKLNALGVDVDASCSVVKRLLTKSSVSSLRDFEGIYR